MSAMTLKIQTKHQTIYALRQSTDGPIYLADESGKLYLWDAEGNGYPGAIQHGGNFLNSTEYREPSRGGGNWVCKTAEFSLPGYPPHVRTDCLYLINDIPTLADVVEMLENGAIKTRWGEIRWEVWRTSPKVAIIMSGCNMAGRGGKREGSGRKPGSFAEAVDKLSQRA